MITELGKPFNRATIAVKPEDVLLMKGSWVHFSSQWPKDQNFSWASGGFFEVSADPVLTRYPVSRRLYGQDYTNLDLSNNIPPGTPGAPMTLQMYPAKPGVLYQIGIGMKKGSYFVQLYIPLNVYVYNVGSSAIYPDITNATYRYLGAKYPKDSPEAQPLWYLYAIMNQPAFIIQPYVDGVNFDKATLVFNINKCVLTPITDPAKLGAAQQSALLIEWYTELQGF